MSTHFIDNEIVSSWNVVKRKRNVPLSNLHWEHRYGYEKCECMRGGGGGGGGNMWAGTVEMSTVDVPIHSTKYNRESTG